MKNTNPLFNIMTSKFFILTLLLILTANICFSQWKTEQANNIKNDIIISYEVIYDKELSLDEKKSSEYLSKITIAFNKDNITERKLGNKLKTTNNFSLYNFNTLKAYLVMGSTKKAIQFDFKDPEIPVEPTANNDPKIIFEFPCEKGLTLINNIPKEIYYTKKIGLRYCRQFKIDGFLMEYPGYSKTLGHYTVKATKIVYDDLPNSFYSLADYKIQTLEEYKKNNQVSNKKTKEIPRISTETKITTFTRVEKKNENTMLEDALEIKPSELDKELLYNPNR